MLGRIQEAIRADATRGRDVEQVGPFVATFTRGDANPFLNYAIPDAGAAPTSDEVERLEAAFAARGLTPRLEYVPELAPLLEQGLISSGFAVELRTPLMRHVRTAEPVAPDGIELIEAGTREDVRAVLSVQYEAYGEVGEPDDARVDGVLRGIERGALMVLARTGSGESAGAGQCTVPSNGATELTSVGVRVAYRRRGIAEAMAAWLAATATSRGADLVFLMAHGDDEARIYERAGFARIGEVVHLSKVSDTIGV